MNEARVWVGPEQPEVVLEAVERAGGRVVPSSEANVVVWCQAGQPPEAILEVLHDGVEWVQLDLAGIERWLAAGVIDARRRWTAAQGVYAVNVAEHVVAFVLAAARKLVDAARATEWTSLIPERVRGTTVGIVGAGGIGVETIARLAPFGVKTLALTRTGRPVPGATRSVGPEALDEVLSASDYVVLAVPLTPATARLVGARELDLIGPSGWLVNVARGRVVDTDALVAALEERRIAGACLDVTDPEPLPAGHPLWGFANVLITPHNANAWGVHQDLFAERVEENVRRFRGGRELVGPVDLERSY